MCPGEIGFQSKKETVLALSPIKRAGRTRLDISQKLHFIFFLLRNVQVTQCEPINDIR